MMLILTRSVSMSLMMGYIFLLYWLLWPIIMLLTLIDVGKRDMGERTPHHPLLGYLVRVYFST